MSIEPHTEGFGMMGNKHICVYPKQAVRAGFTTFEIEISYVHDISEISYGHESTVKLIITNCQIVFYQQWEFIKPTAIGNSSSLCITRPLKCDATIWTRCSHFFSVALGILFTQQGTQNTLVFFL